MAAFDPSVALNICENALREIIRHTFRETWGAGWIEKVTKPDQRTAWAEREEVDQRHTRKGVVEVPAEDLFDSSQFYELLDLADTHWDKLAAALGKKAATFALLQRFEDIRDRVAHSRTILEFEKDLMSGIAGQIRNQVTKYMSTQDPHGEYYPRIDSIIDEFGHQILAGPPASADGELLAGRQTKTVLKPGQIVRFRCRGTDPQDRNLTWRLEAGHGKREEVTAASGDAVVLTWNVDESDVRASIPAQIYVTSDGKYHRCAGFDQRAFFMYSAAPPDGLPA